MENVGRDHSDRLMCESLAQHNRSLDIDAASKTVVRKLIQAEAGRQADRRMAPRYGIVLDISEDEADHDRSVVDPNHGPHERVMHPPSKLKQTLLDIPRVHDCRAGTGLTPMQRFAAISTIDEPWPLYARDQMARMGIAEGDPTTARRRIEAAYIVAEANGQPNASSDALNECSRVKSGTEPPSRTQKEQRMVRRSLSHGPMSSGG
ncbi:hypothetical protein LTR86_010203 [Recurvomyces mirabilis]|nr:hypothetical protein LTR86_010203 [Recurvomyces mirabilis]